MRSLSLLISGLLLSAPAAHAQAPLRSTRFETPALRTQLTVQQPVSNGRMALGGLAMGAIGFFGGGFAGALLFQSEEDDPDGLDALERFAIGAVIGETALLPLGVHIANKRQGNLFPAILASAAITGASLAIATSGEDQIELLIPVPLVQLVASIAIERATTN